MNEESSQSQSESQGFNLSQGTFDVMLQNMFPSCVAGFKSEYVEEDASGSSDQIEFTLEKTSSAPFVPNYSASDVTYGSPINSQLPLSQPLTLLDALGIPSK
jgi:hypothetical protein